MRLRRILIASALVVSGTTIGFFLRSCFLSLRFGPVSLSRARARTSLDCEACALQASGAFVRRTDPLVLRLFAPAARIDVEARKNLTLTVENIFPESEIFIDAKSFRTAGTGLSFRLAGGAGHRIRIVPPRVPLRFMVMGDPACRTAEDVRRLVETLDAECRRYRVSFAVLPGDLVHNSPEALRALGESLSGMSVPVYCAPGNHDVAAACGDAYVRNIGPRESAFSLGGCRFVFFDNADEYPPACLTPHGLVRLEGRLRNAAGPTVLVCHKPLEDPRSDGDHFMNRPSAAEMVRDLVAQTDVRLVVSGHISGFHVRKKGAATHLICGLGTAEFAVVTVTATGEPSIQRVLRKESE